MTGDERTLIEANRAFYEAFRGRDLSRLDKLWASEHEVAVIHPGWAAVHGRGEVLESWRRIIEGPSPPDIRCSAERPFLMGDAGFVICRELLGGGELIATNVFVREDGEWRLVHHQAGPVPPAAAAEEPGPPTVH